MSEDEAASSGEDGIGHLLSVFILGVLAFLAGEFWLGQRVDRSLAAGTVQAVSGAGGLKGAC